jgi:predicted metal-dependent hydrolase
MMRLLVLVICIPFVAFGAAIARLAWRGRARRTPDAGFEYVYVNDDGSARELNEEERDYLRTEFHPADGARPYIKQHYRAVAPNGRMQGYLRRRRLPPDVVILPPLPR